MDPGNDVLSCVLCVCICRSGACVHDVHEKYLDEQCAACKKMLKLTEVLSNCSEMGKMAQAQFLLLAMQRRYSSLRFNPNCDCEKAGDVVEATGGILSPWRVSAGVVVRQLTDLFGLSRDDVLETVQDIGALALQCKIFYTQICRSEPNEDARAPLAYATIRDRVVPAIRPCSGRMCPVCESLAAVRASVPVPLATCLLYTSPSPRDATLSRMPSSA